MKLTDIAKAIANHAQMPYTWEDVLNRLKERKPLPYKLFEYDKQPLNKEDESVLAKYTEGICNDGAGILKDGRLITVSEILKELNKQNK